MHIVIVNRWPRFHDGRRWDNELTRYEDFIDHRKHRVSYVVDPNGAAGVLASPQDIATTVRVDDVNDVRQLLDAVRLVQDRQGSVDCLIALSEFTLEVAAAVRAELGIPGPRPDEVARYRDKTRMKEIVARHGLRTPRFRRCETVGQTLEAAGEIGFPLILKPLSGAASIGVVRAENREHLAAALEGIPEGAGIRDYQIESFIDGDIYHIDGFIDAEGRIRFQTVSYYINTCLDFANGKPLGSVILNPSPLRRQIERFSEQCCRALDLSNTAFHLEVFIDPAGEPVFLEIGARVGGAEVPHLLNRQFGVNLYELFLRSLTGERLEISTPVPEASGGWLVIPKPAALPCRVVRADSMRGRVPSLWRELIPLPGEALEPGGSYDALHSGRFIFCADRQEQVDADIRRTIDEYRFEARPAA